MSKVTLIPLYEAIIGYRSLLGIAYYYLLGIQARQHLPSEDKSQKKGSNSELFVANTHSIWGKGMEQGTN